MEVKKMYGGSTVFKTLPFHYINCKVVSQDEGSDPE
jgi:hypothetical protein